MTLEQTVVDIDDETVEIAPRSIRARKKARRVNEAAWSALPIADWRG